MAIKSVFGHKDGNINKQCTLVGEYSEGKLWVVTNEFSIAIEKDDVLYRLGYVGVHGVVGYEGPGGARREVYGTRVSEKYVARYTDLAKDGKLIAEIKNFCDNSYKSALERRNEMLMDKQSRPQSTYCNVNYFKLLGTMSKYDTIVGINAEIKAHKEELDAADLRAQEADVNHQRLEYRKKLIAEVVADEYIDADDFVTLADEFEVKIPLRTRGWILNKLSDIKSNSLRWQPAKKSDRASDKAIPLYREVRAKVLESLVSDQEGSK
ncbi:hypothetical protein VPHK45_0033 [Vibrio phage K45]